MNTDIRINIMFLQHPKTIKLRKRLGDGAIISMLSLWCFVAQNRPEGILFGMDEEDIEIAAQWSGEPGVFVKTLVALRWIDQENGTFSIHDWKTNNPWVADAENRSEKAKKAVNSRWEREKQRQQELQDLYSSNTQVIPPNEVSNTPFPSFPSLTLPSLKEEMMAEKFSIFEFRTAYHQASGEIMPAGLNNQAADICSRYPRSKLEYAFEQMAVHGGKSFKYFEEILKGKKKPRPVNKEPPKTFEQIKMDNTKQAMAEFLGDDFNDGYRQETICITDGRAISSLPV